MSDLSRGIVKKNLSVVRIQKALKKAEEKIRQPVAQEFRDGVQIACDIIRAELDLPESDP